MIGSDIFFVSRIKHLAALTGPSRGAFDLPVSRVRRRRRPDELRRQSRIPTVRSAFTPAGFSKVRSRPTCRSSSPRKYELFINLKTAKALGLHCAAGPTRPRRRGHRVSNCHLVAGRSLITSAASRLALRAPALRAATALTRPNRSAQPLPYGRHAVPTRRRSAHTTSSRSIALSVVIILRITATIVTFGFFPAASRRSWNALSPGFPLLALIAAM